MGFEEIKKEIKKIDSSTKKLREFGLVVGIVFALIGAVAWWRGKGFYPAWVAAGLFLIVFGLIVPQWLKSIQRVWMTLAILMGWVMSRILLTILFYLAVTPIGILTRLAGKDFLDLKFNDGQNSYWKKRPSTKRGKEDFEKQF